MAQFQLQVPQMSAGTAVGGAFGVGGAIAIGVWWTQRPSTSVNLFEQLGDDGELQLAQQFLGGNAVNKYGNAAFYAMSVAEDVCTQRKVGDYEMFSKVVKAPPHVHSLYALDIAQDVSTPHAFGDLVLSAFPHHSTAKVHLAHRIPASILASIFSFVSSGVAALARLVFAAIYIYLSGIALGITSLARLIVAFIFASFSGLASGFAALIRLLFRHSLALFLVPFVVILFGLLAIGLYAVQTRCDQMEREITRNRETTAFLLQQNVSFKNDIDSVLQAKALLIADVKTLQNKSGFQDEALELISTVQHLENVNMKWSSTFKALAEQGNSHKEAIEQLQTSNGKLLQQRKNSVCALRTYGTNALPANNAFGARMMKIGEDDFEGAFQAFCELNKANVMELQRQTQTTFTTNTYGGQQPFDQGYYHRRQ